MVWFSFFNSISTFVGYLMPKLSLKKNSNGTTQCITRSGGVHKKGSYISQEY